MSLNREQIGRLGLAGGMFAFAWVLLRTAWFCDDAYISFRVVENFVAGYGLRWNVADRVQVFTHPLWVLLHIPLRALTGEIYYTSMALGATLSIGTVGLLAGRVARASHAGVLAIALAVSSKALTDYSTSGLENPLTHLLLVLFFLAGLREGDPQRTLRLQAWLTAALILNRMDTLLFVAPVLALAVWRLKPRRVWRPVLPPLLVCTAWFGFATFYYGSPFPNTAAAKLGSGVGTLELFRLGLRYAAASLREDPLTLATVAAGLLLAILRRRHLPMVAGVALYLLYVARIGGDFMNGRFFAAPFVVAVALLVREAADWPRVRVWVAGIVVLAVGLVPAGAPLRAGPDYGRGQEILIDAWGVADERGYYFRNTGLWNNRKAKLPRDDRWVEAVTARQCGFRLGVAGAVGFYGYEAGPTLHIVDYHALADPVLSRLPAVEEDLLYKTWFRKLNGEDPATNRRIGHYYRNIPPGYVSYLVGDDTRFETDAMRRHVETVTTAMRAPLVSRERLDALFELAFGSTADGLDGPAQRQFRPIPVAEILGSPAGDVYTATIRGCSIMNSDPQAALEPLRFATSQCADNGLAWHCLAGAARQAGATEEALTAYRRFAEFAPDADWAHEELGRALLVARRPGDAIAPLQRALELNRWSVTAHRGVASAQANLGNFEAAAKQLDEALSLYPRETQLWRDLASVRALAGDADGAARARTEAERLAP